MLKKAFEKKRVFSNDTGNAISFIKHIFATITLQLQMGALDRSHPDATAMHADVFQNSVL